MMSKLKKASVEEWIKWAEDRRLSLTEEEVAQQVAKYNEIIASTVPCGNGARLSPTKRPNHAVGECYKPHSKLNIHDPDNQYVWADEEQPVPALVWAGRALFTVGFLTGIYCLVFLGMLL